MKLESPLILLSSTISCALGRPVALRDDEISVPLPSPLDDDSFDVDRPISLNQRDETSLAKGASPFLHLIRFNRLHGQILGLSNNLNHRATVLSEETRRVYHNIQSELCAWRDETQQLLIDWRKVHDQHGKTESRFLTLDWYNALYNKAIIFIQCSILNMSYPSLRTSFKLGKLDVKALVCAAQGSIQSYGKLRQSRKLDVSWTSMQDVFVGGLAYIYSIQILLKNTTANDPIPDILSMIDLTRSCSNILVAICERPGVSRIPSEIFNRLTTKVIADALRFAECKNGHSYGAQNMQTLAGDAIMSPQLTPNLPPSNEGLEPLDSCQEQHSPCSLPSLEIPSITDGMNSSHGLFDMRSDDAEFLADFSHGWSIEDSLNSTI